jgi:hypothetical protein
MRKPSERFFFNLICSSSFRIKNYFLHGKYNKKKLITKKSIIFAQNKKEMISVVKTNTVKIDRFAGWKPDAGVV